MIIIPQQQYTKFWVWSIVLLLFTQYLRPQDLIPGLSGAPLFAPLAGVVLLFAIFSKQNILTTFASPQIRWITAFFVFMVILIPFSQAPGAAVKGVRNFLPLLPFVFSIIILVDNWKTLKRAVDIFISVAIVISIVGYLTHASGKYQAFGLGNFLTDPNDYALYMLTMLPICFFMFTYTKNNLERIFYGTGTMFTLSSIIISFSRGGFIGLIFVSFLMWVFSPNKKVTAAIGAILVIGVVLLSSNQWKDAVSTSFDPSQRTAQTRLTTWKLSYRAFLDHPMGIGITNIPQVMYKYGDNRQEGERWWGNVNHSFWLTALTEGGIIGFAIVMGLLYSNARTCYMLGKIRIFTEKEEDRFLKHFGNAYFAAMIGFCISGTFLTVNYYPHLWYMSGLIAAGGKLLHLRYRSLAHENRPVYNYS